MRVMNFDRNIALVLHAAGCRLRLRHATSKSLPPYASQCRSAEHPTVSAFRAGTIPEVVNTAWEVLSPVDDPGMPHAST